MNSLLINSRFINFLKKNYYCGFIFTAVFLSTNSYSWNAVGHRLVAQIAYDNLNPEIIPILEHYNKTLNRVYQPKNLVSAAPWLDSLRYLNNLWLSDMHYIDTPFSLDNTPLIQPPILNAVSAIALAKNILENPHEKPFNKGFSLRILLHVVGDIHQPLHAVTQISARYPKGDKGGNLVYLKPNPIGRNLHAYWDNGGGYLLSKRYFSQKKLAIKAQKLEKEFPCKITKQNLEANQWAKESFELAKNIAYQIHKGDLPSKAYQHQVQQLVKQRIALAGCRLAAVLNGLILTNPLVKKY